MKTFEDLALKWTRFQVRIARPRFLAFMVLAGLIFAGTGIRDWIASRDQRDMIFVLCGLLLALHSFEKWGHYLLVQTLEGGGSSKKE